MSGKALSQQDAYELGAARESWCAVELQKEQDWCRAQRQHYQQQFKSSVFDSPAPESEARCTFSVNAPTHKERRHFPAKCR